MPYRIVVIIDCDDPNQDQAHEIAEAISAIPGVWQAIVEEGYERVDWMRVGAPHSVWIEEER